MDGVEACKKVLSRLYCKSECCRAVSNEQKADQAYSLQVYERKDLGGSSLFSTGKRKFLSWRKSCEDGNSVRV